MIQGNAGRLHPFYPNLLFAQMHPITKATKAIPYIMTMDHQNTFLDSQTPSLSLIFCLNLS